MEKENKTIEYLNNKAWYRLLKVVYILSFIGLAIGFAIWVFNEEKPEQKLDINTSTIKCYDGKEFKYSDIPSENIFGLYSPNKEEIKKRCGEGHEIDIEALTKSTSGYKPLFANKEVPEKYKTYDYFPKYYTVGSWWEVVGLIIFLEIVTFLSFEFVRRSFYYVVLGKIKPIKSSGIINKNVVREEQSIYCIKCGEKNVGSSSYCEKCGHKLEKNN